jgi:ribonucleoside-diphosphate reductase alpha chain
MGDTVAKGTRSKAEGRETPATSKALTSGGPMNSQAMARTARAQYSPRGLSIVRRFTQPGQNIYATLEWTTRKSVITEPDGRKVFEMDEVEVPKAWSQLATDILASKYFRRAGVKHPRTGEPGSETSARQVVDRIATTFRVFGESHGYFASAEDANAFEDELRFLLVTQRAAFNSPVWFNVGHWHYHGIQKDGDNWTWDMEANRVYEEKNYYARPQGAACQPHHALVSTPKGMVPIGELVERNAVGIEVYDAVGITRVLATKHNGQKEVFRVALANGSFIEATGDHLIKAVVERRTTPKWVELRDLKPGMRLHLHPHVARISHASPRPATGHQIIAAGAQGQVLQTELLQRFESEAALAGWLQADGFVGEYDGTNRSLTVEFMTVNHAEHEWVLSHLDQVFPQVHRNVIDVPAQDPALTVRRIRLYGEELRQFVYEWELLRRGTEIRVPKLLWTAPQPVLAAYLKSVFQGDGFVTNARSMETEQSKIGLTTISERWMEDIQVLLHSMGIYSRRLTKTERRDNREDQQNLTIGIGSERMKFAQKVGFVSPEKQSKLAEGLTLRNPKTCPDLREEEIVEIQSLGVMDVYDIQTESGEYLSNNVAVHNCFIQKVDDHVSGEFGIMDLVAKEARLFKGGSGTGTNFSRIRGAGEPLSSGGKSSGLISFLKILDANAGSIKSGGTTRRAAKMVILDIDHPDVEEFIGWKAHEEKKAKTLLEAGYGLDSQGRPDFNGEAYQTVAGQNSNNSVRVTDAFLQAVQDDKDWSLTRRVDGKVTKTTKARALWHKLGQAAWECADPGVQYDDTIQKWNPCKNTDRINATNPCSEFVFLDETSCNLASVNLLKFYDEKTGFDVEGFRHACRVMFTAQEIGVDLFSYPSKSIAEMTHRTRPLGLGYANLGTLLMCMGLPYNGPEGRAVAAAITSLMHGEAFLQSVELAKVKGPFDLYQENEKPFLEVMEMHREAAHNVEATGSPIPDVMLGTRPEQWFAPIARTAADVWDRVVTEGRKHGFRNAQATVLAPTGTIGLLMDCDTTGVEPEFSLVKWKKLAGGGYFTIINQSVPRALQNLGYSDKQVREIEEHVLGKKDEKGAIVTPGHETVEGAPHLKEEHLAVFDCANRCGDGKRFIRPEGHLFMMAAVQPFLSGAISKTVNLPNEVTVEDIENTYLRGWKYGLKAVALYRDGCKASQPLSSKTEKKEEKAVAVARTEEPKGPKRGELEPLPKFSDSLIKREVTVFDTRLGKVKVHVMLREDPRGQLKEIFLTVGKNGSSIHELCRDLGIAWSRQLRLGLSSKVLAMDLLNEYGSVAGTTDHPLIKSCLSIKDLMGKMILYEYHGATDFINPDVLQSYQATIDYVQPRWKVVQELNELRMLKEQRKEKPLLEFLPEATRAEGIDPNELAAKFMGDAPDCDVCGFKTVRNAACYKCLNCGNSMGCS